MISRLARVAACALLIGGCQSKDEQSGRYQVVMSSSGTPLFVLDTVTGCLDVVSFVNQQWHVNSSAWYPDDQNKFDKNELARLTKEKKATDFDRFLYGNPVPASHSCAKENRLTLGGVK